jgi:hypothetical protein
VLADRLEQLANEALGCPVRQADPTAGPGHTHHFGGSAVLVGTEHCAEGRNHGVEGRTRKRQVLGVGNLELDLKPFRLGAPVCARQERLDIVGACDLAPAPGGRERSVAVAVGDIKHGLAGAQIHALRQAFTDNLQRRTDHGIVAGRPGCLLP